LQDPRKQPQETLQGRLTSIVNELVVCGVELDQARREFERQFIVAALRNNGGNLGRTAECLGIHRNTLRNKLGNLGIEPAEYLPASSRRKRTLG
jgi:DNA-binding NtrC family response regulator